MHDPPRVRALMWAGLTGRYWHARAQLCSVRRRLDQQLRLCSETGFRHQSDAVSSQRGQRQHRAGPAQWRAQQHVCSPRHIVCAGCVHPDKHALQRVRIVLVPERTWNARTPYVRPGRHALIERDRRRTLMYGRQSRRPRWMRSAPSFGRLCSSSKPSSRLPSASPAPSPLSITRRPTLRRLQSSQRCVKKHWMSKRPTADRASGHVALS